MVLPTIFRHRKFSTSPLIRLTASCLGSTTRKLLESTNGGGDLAHCSEHYYLDISINPNDPQEILLVLSWA